MTLEQYEALKDRIEVEVTDLDDQDAEVYEFKNRTLKLLHEVWVNEINRTPWKISGRGEVTV